MIILVVAVLPMLFGHVITELGCRNENGTLVDWYMLYKFPKDSQSENPIMKAGEAYAFLDADNGSWVGSLKSVEDPQSYMASTYSQIIKGKKALAYLLYNDEVPDSHSSSSYYGHTKGILATDGKNVFWLIHSVPKFPEVPESGSYDYPENGKRNGQSLLCITFSFDQLATVVNIFRYTRPHIYSRHIIKELDSLPANLRLFFIGRPKYVNRAPWSTTGHITTNGGQRFTFFGKHQKWGKDLYDALVAPALSSSLYVQSWMVGRGTPLEPDCRDPEQIYNVETLNVKYDSETSALFNTTRDHSKWAAALNNTAPWVCVADINRMHSQFKRGGGAVCLNSSSAWNAYTSTIVDIQGCTL